MRSASALLRSAGGLGAALGVTAVIALSACGGGGDDAASAAVATDEAPTAASDAPAGSAGQGASRFAAFTACLQEQGLGVTEPTFDGQGGPGGQGGPMGGSAPDGSMPPGTPPAEGSPPTDSMPAGGPGGGVPGDGGEISTRIVEMMGLDPDDPTVAAAVEACSTDLQMTAPQPGEAAPSTTEGA